MTAGQSRTIRLVMGLPRDFAAELDRVTRAALAAKHPAGASANALYVYMLARGLQAMEAELCQRAS